jgi:hypothetical protein
MFEGMFGKPKAPSAEVGQGDARYGEAEWVEKSASQMTEEPAVLPEDMIQPQGIPEESIAKGYEGGPEQDLNIADSTPGDAIAPEDMLTIPSEPTLTPGEHLEALYGAQREALEQQDIAGADALQEEISALESEMKQASNEPFKEAA